VTTTVEVEEVKEVGEVEGAELSVDGVKVVGAGAISAEVLGSDDVVELTVERDVVEDCGAPLLPPLAAPTMASATTATTRTASHFFLVKFCAFRDVAERALPFATRALRHHRSRCGAPASPYY
jgi:hypothetical protein